MRLALQRWIHTQIRCWDEPRSGACSEAVATDPISFAEHDKKNVINFPCFSLEAASCSNAMAERYVLVARKPTETVAGYSLESALVCREVCPIASISFPVPKACITECSPAAFSRHAHICSS